MWVNIKSFSHLKNIFKKRYLPCNPTIPPPIIPQENEDIYPTQRLVHEIFTAAVLITVKSWKKSKYN